MARPDSAYSINHDGLWLHLAIVELSRLHPHEETIPEQLEKLKKNINDRGMLEAPVIVDSESMVVLDGMHRVQALRDFGCVYALACFVDYRDPRITLGRWCRVISRPFTVADAMEFSAKVGLKIEPITGINPITSIENLLVFGSGTYRLFSEKRDILSIFKESYIFESSIRVNNRKIEYMSEDDAINKLASGKITTILCPPSVTKDQVVEIASSGRVFTPKATRHHLPARPIGVGVPISLLNNPNTSIGEANHRLRIDLKQKKLRKIPPGSKFLGRKYDETLYVFED